MKKYFIYTASILLIGVVTNNNQVFCQEDLITEFMNGKTIRFCTSNLPKSLDLDLCIKFPNEMKNSDGNRPHIVQKFRKYGTPETYMIIIQKTESELTNSDLDEFFSQSNIIKMGNEAGSVLTLNQNVKIDGLRACSVEIKSLTNQLGIDLITFSQCFYVIYKDYLITLIGSSGGRKEDGEIVCKARFEKAKILFNLMTNSVVIENQWINSSNKDNATEYFKWFEFVPANFKIKLPSDPHVETINQRVNNQYISRIIYTSHGDEESFQVSYFDLNLDNILVNDTELNKYFDKCATLTASELNGTIISQSEFKYKTFKGREVKIEGIISNIKIKYVVRFFLIGNRQYTLLFFTKPETYRINLMYEFFNSFQYLN